MKLAFLGLGIMGYPMAKHLAKASSVESVAVFNRTQKKTHQWMEELKMQEEKHAPSVQIDAFSSPALAVQDADITFMCLGDDVAIRNVVYGATGALAGMDKEKMPILVDHSTTSLELTNELYQNCIKQGIGFLDAPVSGGQQGAEKGMLTVMMGGKKEHFQRVVSVLSAYAKIVAHMGASGTGQLAKLVNQICIAGLLQGLSEGLTFARAAKLDMEKLLATLKGGAAQSWQMDHRGATMDKAQFDFGFAIDWMVKDLSLARKATKNLAMTLPTLNIVLDYYKTLQKKGFGRLDTSALIKLLQ